MKLLILLCSFSSLFHKTFNKKLAYVSDINLFLLKLEVKEYKEKASNIGYSLKL